MIDVLRWLIVLEVAGVVALPLSLWMFQRLPDRGYGLSKTFALVLLTFGTWIVGEALPIAGGIWLPIGVLVVLGALSWWLFGDRVAAAWREIPRAIVVEEALFLVAFIGWSLMRAYVFHPGIGHTEQYMDMSILGASVRSVSYPPYDPWMSGHTMNYYYLGYVMYSLVVKLSGVLPAIGYNLALSTLFAFVVSNCYSVGLALTRRLIPALAAPVAVALLGNWYPLLDQLPHDIMPSAAYWFWNPTRVIGNQSTINEFPNFSFTLGDLHPHVMALPVTVLAIALGLSFLYDPARFSVGRDWRPYLRIILAAICVGSLFVMNSWDFPTYAILVAGCMGIAAYVNDTSARWWREPLKSILLFGACSLALFAPFYLQYHAPTHGFGWVTTPSSPGEFLEVFGLFALACALLLFGYLLLLQPAPDEEEEKTASDSRPRNSALELGAAQIADSPLLVGALVALMVLVLGIRFGVWVLLGAVLLSLLALSMLHRAMNTDEPNRSDLAALLIIALGFAVLALPEIAYIRDAFDGGSAYRMNTVFKFDYQGWTLLGIGAAFALGRASSIARSLFQRWAAIVVAAVILIGAAASAIYPLYAWQSFNWGGTAIGLDGTVALKDSLAAGDYGAIVWLRDHAAGNPVELEATGKAYDATSARVSTFTGLPTVMGWADHEGQWRGSDDPEIQARVDAVKTAYTTHSVATARDILRRYHVRYVFAGTTEQALPGADLTKFKRFMRVAYRDSGATIYTW